MNKPRTPNPGRDNTAKPKRHPRREAEPLQKQTRQEAQAEAKQEQEEREYQRRR